MHVADQPAPFHVAHDVFDGIEGFRRGRLVTHRQEDAGDDLDDESQERQRAEHVEPVEILRRVIAGDVVLHQLVPGEPLAEPARQPALAPTDPRRVLVCRSPHHAASVSTPTRIVDSLMYWCGGTTRFRGAGTPRQTRPARSNLEPWQAQKNPPGQSAPRSGVPGSKRAIGEQPRCVHEPITTSTSGRMERCWLAA